jgi:hypothetical protein
MCSTVAASPVSRRSFTSLDSEHTILRQMRLSDFVKSTLVRFEDAGLQKQFFEVSRETRMTQANLDPPFYFQVRVELSPKVHAGRFAIGRPSDEPHSGRPGGSL